MGPQTINVLLSSFPGLGLPPTFCFQISRGCSEADVLARIDERLPSALNSRLIVTNSANKQLSATSRATISTLLPENASILPLRLSAPLCGGKGGFGSQLRAAGGRMSSRKKKAQGETNGSSRNLDGRRLRTVAEAKALAEYLAVKPDMDKKEKEERKKRWESVVEAANKQEEDIKSGKGKGKVDGKWLEAKEEAELKMREAVHAAMNSLGENDELMEDGDSSERSNASSSSEERAERQASASSGTPPTNPKDSKIFGWDDDEDDEDMSDSEAEEEEEEEPRGS